MRSIKSADGTRISYEKTGSGPPMVLVHGIAYDRNYWDKVQPSLAEYFTVFAIDRRGRGQSGDGADYKLEWEFEDVATVVDNIDQPVILLGHSFGGLIALEAALRTDNLKKMILYEPPFSDQVAEPGDLLLENFAKIENSLREGKKEQALLLFLENVLKVSSEEIDIARLKKCWQDIVDTTPALIRELQAAKQYKFDAARFEELTIPILLLSGSESSNVFKETTKKLNRSLSNSRVAFLKGQENEAAKTAPNLFADEVLKFARE